MNKQEATKQLADLVLKFETALNKAEQFATKHSLEFSISPAYGMGGYFNGKPTANYDEHGWNPSSQSC